MVLRNKLLEKRGLNIIHPWCAFLYLLLALILTMCTMNPFLIGTSLIAGIIYEIHTIGFKKFSKYIIGLVLIVVITTIGNMCISHNGENVLFMVIAIINYLNIIIIIQIMALKLFANVIKVIVHMI